MGGVPLARSCALCALRRCIPVRELRARSGVLCRRAAAYSAAEDVLCLPAVDATRFQDVVERDDLLLHLLHGQRHDGCSFWDWLKRFTEASLGCKASGLQGICRFITVDASKTMRVGGLHERGELGQLLSAKRQALSLGEARQTPSGGISLLVWTGRHRAGRGWERRRHPAL